METIKYLLGADPDNGSPEVNLEIDQSSDVIVTQEDTGMLYLSLTQAKALHYALGQAIIRFDRSWNFKQPKPVAVA